MLLSGPRAWPGVALVVVGEAVRLWAVGHIGLPSRTRDDGVGPLIATGPYARVRNPLYVGNIVIWAGFGVVCWPWVVGVLPLSCLYYDRIVRWEEANLLARIGSPYEDYLRRVPRWWPRLESPASALGTAGWDPRRALRAERSTLIALTLVVLAFAVRARFPS